VHTADSLRHSTMGKADRKIFGQGLKGGKNAAGSGPCVCVRSACVRACVLCFVLLEFAKHHCDDAHLRGERAAPAEAAGAAQEGGTAEAAGGKVAKVQLSSKITSMKVRTPKRAVAWCARALCKLRACAQL